MAAPKILLVDDTKLFLRLEQEYLKQSSVAVFTASNGREALETARRIIPDLIFMDLNMPEMNGIECCAAIKADPFLCRIPVILVTTMGMDDSVEQCRRAGCDGFLTKPIDRKAFLDLGRSFLPGINRRERRANCRLKALFRVNNGEFRRCTCLDLNSRGVYIACDGAVSPEDKVEISVMVSGNSNDLAEAWGRVAWVNTGSSRVKQQLAEGFGVEFLAITDESTGLIKQFILNAFT
jgi:CheY-like chemotaxis protein